MSNQVQLTRDQYNKVYNFFTTYKGFRSIEACSYVTSIDLELCRVIHNYIYGKRLIGGYYFEETIPPQKFMNYYIKDKFKELNYDSKILEIGPGEYPLFDFNKYNNWVAVDPNYYDNKIQFEHREWAVGKYPTDKIIRCDWSKLSEQLSENSFDFVVSSHVFEHVFKPITCLKEAYKVLKPNGKLVMFVPDGYMCDFNLRLEVTHMLYLVPDMIEEFFYYAGGFKDITVEQFRPDYDIVITATKIADKNIKEPVNKVVTNEFKIQDLDNILHLENKKIVEGLPIDHNVDICILHEPDEILLLKSSLLSTTLVIIVNKSKELQEVINYINRVTGFLFYIYEKYTDKIVIICER